MKVGLLGAGTIGYGVWELAKRRGDIEITRVLDRRDIAGLEGVLTKSADDVLGDPEIECVVELLGGVEPARSWVARALKSGKHVVTANKLMVSEHLRELTAIARESGAEFRFDPAVGGSIPFLFNILRARRADEIFELGGILNGTTNYMLTLMQSERVSFSSALKLAQDAGYAEADADADISGGDAVSKITLAASMAFSGIIDKKLVLREGIEAVTPEDMDMAAEQGRSIKLLARAVRVEGGAGCYVEPAIVRTGSVVGQISGVENMACFRTANAGLQRFTGAGAGRYPTAYAVIDDILDIILNRGAYEFSVPNTEIAVKNELETHEYIVRGIDIEGAKRISGAHSITPPISVMRMHTLARNARAQGKTPFFAGVID